MLDCGLPRERTSDAYLRGFQTGDLVLVAGSFFSAALFSSGEEFWLSLQVEPINVLTPIFAASLSVLIFLRLAGNYGRLTSFERLQQVSAALGASFLLEALLSYAKAPLILAFPVMAGASVLCAFLLPLWFLIYRSLFPAFPPAQRYLLAGDDPALDAVERGLAAQARRFRTAGPIPDASQMLQALREFQPDRIVMGFRNLHRAPSAEALLDIRLAGIVIQDAAAAYEDMLHRVSLSHLRPSRILFGKLGPERRNLALQAIYSNIGGLAALVVASPLLILLFAALKLTAPGTAAIEKQECAGLYGIPFFLLRFQSRTWLGARLARAGLARLPQLVNVVRGEMALAGPRPECLEFIDALQQQIPFYMQRLAVKPGFTGWAQLHGAGRNARSGDVALCCDTLLELEYDFYYIQCLSPGFDL